MPFKALQLGADPLHLGALAAASTGTYAILASVMGRLSDRVPRTRLARASCIGVILACIGMTLSTRVSHMLLCIPILGGSMSLFWPSVQASIADRVGIAELQHHLGRFNLSWSTGKGLGFLVGGFLVTTLGPAGTMTVACGIACVIFMLLPGQPGTAGLGPIAALLHGGEAAAGPPPAGPERVAAAASVVDTASPSPPPLPPEEPDLDARAPRFRRLAWAANGAAFGLGSTLVYHYPRVVQEHGWSPRTFGIFLGLVYLTQTVAFALLMLRPEVWRFRRLRLYVPQIVMVVAVLALPFMDLRRLIVSSLVFGAGLGICYYSSIYYSLHTHTRRGRNAGVHETLIGLGSMVVPFLGGLLARLFGALWVPYVVAAGAVALSLVVQEALYRRADAAAARPQSA